MEQNEYFNDLAKIKETITENRNKAMVVVNSAMIITYYQIGTIINQRKTWSHSCYTNLKIQNCALCQDMRIILKASTGIICRYHKKIKE